MINGQIRDKEVRVISEDGEQLGIMSSKDAMKLSLIHIFLLLSNVIASETKKYINDLDAWDDTPVPVIKDK